MSTPTTRVDVLVSLADRLRAPLKRAEDDVAKASERMNRRLNLSLKLAGGGAAAAGIAAVTKRTVTSFTDSIRDVERAKGELATLGVRDLDAVVNKGLEMQTQLAGVTADAFVRASYDIKSGISNLSDQGVAEMTASAMVVAKATKGQAEQMTSLFATSYGIFKQHMEGLSDAEFGEQFGAVLAASVKQFKTDGAKMQQAIESAGAGAAQLGMAMDEQMTLLGMMQQQMQAGEAGTALRAFATNAAKAHEAFAEMQVTAERPVTVRVLDENGQLRAMPEILTDLKTRYGETLDAFEAAEIKDAFGTEEAMKMINALYGQEKAVRANVDALAEAGARGSEFTTEMARLADNNWDSTMVLIGQQVDALQQKIGQRLLPAVERLAPVVSAFVDRALNWVDANPELVTGIGAVVVGLGAFAAVMAPILLGAAALTSSLGMIASGATAAGSVFMFLGRVALPLVRGAVVAIGRALIANPIGLAVAAVATAAYLIYDNWDGVVAFFKRIWDQAKAAFGAAAAWIKETLSGMSPINWGGIIGLELLQLTWSVVSGWLADAMSAVWDNLPKIDWASLVNLDRIKEVWAEATEWLTGKLSAIWDALPEFPKFSLWGDDDEIEDPETLLAASEASEQLQEKFPVLEAAARNAEAVIRSAVSNIASAVQAIDLEAEGTRIARSLARGLRNATREVTRAAERMARSIERALPRGVNVNVALAGAPGDVQRRAKGGSFRPGWLLTGEEGPELEYRSEGGYIAHHNALRGMHDLASRTSAIMAGLASGGGRSVPALATVAASGAPAGRGQVAFAPTYNVPMSFAPGVDIEEVRRTVRDELVAAEERAQADMRRMMHDG